MSLNLSPICGGVFIARHVVNADPDVLARTVVLPAHLSIMGIDTVAQFTSLANIEDGPFATLCDAQDDVNGRDILKLSACEWNTDKGVTSDCDV